MSTDDKSDNVNQNNQNEGPKENEYVKRMIKDGKKLPTDTTVLYGYVGRSDSENVIRLYTDINFKEYYEIDKKDLKDWKENTEGNDPFGGTHMFVDSDAEVKIVKIQVTKVRARFLAGVISEKVRPQRKAFGRRIEEGLGYRAITEDSCDYTCMHTNCPTCGDTCPPCHESEFCTWETNCGTCYDDTCRHKCYYTLKGDTCRGDTCRGDTCGYTCEDTCDNTCRHTCHNTCDYTCEDTCHACPREEYGQYRPDAFRRNLPRRFKYRSRRYRRR